MFVLELKRRMCHILLWVFTLETTEVFIILYGCFVMNTALLSGMDTVDDQVFRVL